MARLPFLSSLLGLLSILLVSVQSASAAIVSKGATFVYTSSDIDGAQVVFALNVNKETGDLYFHLSAPSGQSWVGVGVGSQMAGSTMFVAYASSNGTGVTLSPRTATGHVEPAYDSSIALEPIYADNLANGNTVTDSTIVANAVCRNCTKFLGSNLDLSSTAQQFIFALGPTFRFQYAEDSPSAGLQEHQYYGHFTMDMTKATSASSGAVPAGPYTQSGASGSSITVDNDPAAHIHGAVMSLVFVILLPLGSLILRVWEKVRIHAIIQTIALVLFCMAFAGGSVVSTKFQRSMNFSSGHQILGILLLVALLTQLVLGIVNHRAYKRTGQGTKMGKIHLYLGPAIMFFGLVNGGLGFQLAQMSQMALPYVIGIAIIAIIYSAVRFCCFNARRRAGRKNGNDPDGFQFPQFNNNNNATRPPPSAPTYSYPAGGPPAYGESETRIPLQTYQSSNSVQQLPMNPTEPRGMV